MAKISFLLLKQSDKRSLQKGTHCIVSNTRIEKVQFKTTRQILPSSPKS